MRVIIFGQPQGKARARTVSRGGATHSYTPQKTAAYEKLIKQTYKLQSGDYFASDPVKLHVDAYFKIPKSWKADVAQAAKLGLMVPAKKPDCDNILKVVADALNEVAYVDDCQIIAAKISKRYSDRPRLEIEVTRAI